MTRRYLLVKVVCENKLTDQQFYEVLHSTLRKYFGELGLTRIDPKVMRFDSDSATGIVSCERGGTADLASAIALVTKISELPLTLTILRVSGTLKGVRKGLSKQRFSRSSNPTSLRG